MSKTKMTKKEIFNLVKEGKQISKEILMTLSIKGLDDLENMIYDELEENKYTDDLITVIASVIASKKADENSKSVASRKALNKNLKKEIKEEEQKAIDTKKELKKTLKDTKKGIKEDTKDTKDTKKEADIEAKKKADTEAKKNKALADKKKKEDDQKAKLEKELEIFLSVKKGEKYTIYCEELLETIAPSHCIVLADNDGKSFILTDIEDNTKFEITFDRFIKRAWGKYLDNKKVTYRLGNGHLDI